MGHDCSVTLYLRLNITSKEINLHVLYTLLAFPLTYYSVAQDEKFNRLAIVQLNMSIHV